MSETEAKALSELSELADKIAFELAFVETGADGGLLPIHAFVSAMEGVCGQGGVKKSVAEAVGRARAEIDAIFSGAGVFTTGAVKRLGEWAPWFQGGIAALKRGEEFAPLKLAAAQENIAAGPGFLGDEESFALNLPEDRELLQEFVHESREHLQNIETGALILEEKPRDRETLNSIFRAFHTFKGGSGFLSLAPINRLAHELESLLEMARQGKVQAGAGFIEIILEGGDTLKRFINVIDGQLGGRGAGAPISIPTAEMTRRIAAFIAAPAAVITDEKLADVGVAPEDGRAAGKAAGGGTIKVDTGKLDNLIDMVGEMVIAESLVAQEANLNTATGLRLSRNLAELARTTKDLQRAAMALRMVPIRGTFQKMTRLVRDLAQRSGKEVTLMTAGEDSELDRNIVEEIDAPLVHMLRNAVDHGIEAPAARRAAGKPEMGVVELSAHHRGGNFVIQIRDDGAGLSKERILRKALALGLVGPEVDLSDKETFNLIFTPGFSTAETLTDISGRGVGMDVVRRNIEALRGKIEIESKAGQGTTFSIILPLTLAVIDGLVVQVAGDRYILPALSVRESFRPTSDMISRISGRGEIVRVRGRMAPMLRLREWLTGELDESNPCEGTLVMLEADGEVRCVLVDELIAKQEVVIKSMGAAFSTDSTVAGGAILGDGRVALILDVNTLVQPRSKTISKAA